MTTFDALPPLVLVRIFQWLPADIVFRCRRLSLFYDKFIERNLELINPLQIDNREVRFRFDLHGLKGFLHLLPSFSASKIAIKPLTLAICSSSNEPDRLKIILQLLDGVPVAFLSQDVFHLKKLHIQGFDYCITSSLSMTEIFEVIGRRILRFMKIESIILDRLCGNIDFEAERQEACSALVELLGVLPDLKRAKIRDSYFLDARLAQALLARRPMFRMYFG